MAGIQFDRRENRCAGVELRREGEPDEFGERMWRAQLICIESEVKIVRFKPCHRTIENRKRRLQGALGPQC